MVSLLSDSFFGEHTETTDTEYFAKGYVAWLYLLQVPGNIKDAYSIFTNKYKSKIKQLSTDGFLSSDTKVNSALDYHIEAEWGYFIDGIYGLCTKSGLPEDIASKELAILIIKKFESKDILTDPERAELIKAVSFLDSVSSLFAPHERIRSSRYRLINEVRRKFKLMS